MGGERVGEAETARVVQVRGFQLVADLLLDAAEHTADLRGIRIAHGVGERDAVHAGLGQHHGQAHHVVFGHLALHGAAERGGDAGLDFGTAGAV